MPVWPSRWRAKAAPRKGSFLPGPRSSFPGCTTICWAVPSLSKAWPGSAFLLPCEPKARRDLLLDAEALFEAVAPQYRRMRQGLKSAQQFASMGYHSIPGEGLQRSRIELGLLEAALEAAEEDLSPELWLGPEVHLDLGEVRALARATDVSFLFYAIGHDPSAALLPSRFGGRQQEDLLERWLHVWNITPAGETLFRQIEVDRSGGGGSLVDLVNSALTDLREGEASWGEELAALLITPIADWLPPAGAPPRRVVIVTQGSLARVPFSALPLPQSSGTGLRQVLLDRCEVLSAPCLSYAVATARRPPSTRSAVLAVGNPAGSGLPRAASEAANVARQFGAVALTGAAATREAAISLLPTARYFHFAGHCDGERLLLAGAHLGILEILDLELDLDLAVLAACHSAANDRGEAAPSLPETPIVPFDLARAFLLRGTRQVLATLWSIDDGASAELMESVYRGISHGRSLPESLRQAMLGSREAGRPAADWAGFVALGGCCRTPRS